MRPTGANIPALCNGQCSEALSRNSTSSSWLQILAPYRHALNTKPSFLLRLLVIMQSSSGWTWKNLVFNSAAILPFNAEETSAIRCRMYGARVSILSHGMYAAACHKPRHDSLYAQVSPTGMCPVPSSRPTNTKGEISVLQNSKMHTNARVPRIKNWMWNVRLRSLLLTRHCVVQI